MIKLEVSLTDDEWEALAKRQRTTLRPIDREARWLIRCSLIRDGWLKVDQKAKEACMKLISKE